MFKKIAILLMVAIMSFGMTALTFADEQPTTAAPTTEPVTTSEYSGGFNMYGSQVVKPVSLDEASDVFDRAADKLMPILKKVGMFMLVVALMVGAIMFVWGMLGSGRTSAKGIFMVGATLFASILLMFAEEILGFVFYFVSTI